MWQRLLIAVMVVLLLLAGLLGLWRYQWQVTEVTVESQLRYLQLDEVNAVTEQWLNDSLWQAPMARYKNEIEALPWVASASVRLAWPDKVVLDIVEHRPVAAWNKKSLISDQNLVFGPVQQIANLPKLIGPEHSMQDVVDRYIWLYQHFATADNPIMLVRLTERGSWEIGLRSGLVIRLGNEQLQLRAQRARALIAALGNKIANVEYLDARYANGVAVKEKETPTDNAQL